MKPTWEFHMAFENKFNHMKNTLLLLIIMLASLGAQGASYYVNADRGDDTNSGLSPHAPFKSLNRVNALLLRAGDKVLLAGEQTFKGQLILSGVKGSKEQPVLISAYQPNDQTNASKPIIDAQGFFKGIKIVNSSHIHVQGIEVCANGGEKPQLANQQLMRCGVLVTTSQKGHFTGINLTNLLVRDVFFEKEGFQRGSAEVKTPNGKQNYGWGIRFINATPGAKLTDLVVENCAITNVAHTGIKFTGKNKTIANIKVLNCSVSHTGGPGIQMSGVHNGVVHGNVVNCSGSNNDSRKWGRGSGLWTWGSSDIIIEHNRFSNANGPGDSAGCHIDYNCNNVVVQYNFSMNNAGGFCEILGNNFNCAYRYNVSVNDGQRVKGENGAFQEGKVLWLSGYQGHKKRSGPFNSYIYNNTIFVKDGVVAKMAIDYAAAGVFIANNIFVIEGESKLVLGDQYKPQKKDEAEIQGVMFKNNLFMKKANWPVDAPISDEDPIFGDPQFVNAGGSNVTDYLPRNKALVKDKGLLPQALPADSIGLFNGLIPSHDILGNPIIGLPDLGAFEINN